MIENVPVKPPSEMAPVFALNESGVDEDKFNVNVAESGPDKAAGRVPFMFEKMK